MSNRNEGQNYRNSANPRKKFVPKRDPQNSSQQETLSNSLRAASVGPTTTLGSSGGGGGSGVNAVTASMGRVRMGENGDWVPTYKTPLAGHFVNYLPQDEAVATGLGADEGALDPLESQRVVDLLNRELSRLLKLSPREFWKEVASDVSLHDFLESFLKFRSRWYDFPYRGARGIAAGVIVCEFELCQRVFMVLYRISSNRDPGAKAADALSPKDHEALLQDKKLLDLPKLLDICAIYGHENKDLTKILVVNAMKAQPSIQDDLPVVASHFLNVVQTMYQRCSSSLEVLLSSGGGHDLGSNHLHSDYLEVMDFVNDAVVSMDSFVTAYKPAAVFFASPVEMSFGNEELLTTLARLHDSLLPSLWRGFNIIYVVEDGNRETLSDMLSNVFISLNMLSRRIANFGWKILNYCYLSDDVFQGSCSFPVSVKMFPANVDDPATRADILIQSLRDLSANYSHVSGRQTGGGTFLQNIEKNHMIMSRIELLQNTGWISIDNEQFQFLSGIMKHPLGTNTKEKSSVPLLNTSNGMQADEDTAIMESKISQIKDLFPDYGKGFLAACLEAYNQDMEEVIQRILEGTLHEELLSLDISMEKIPPSKSAPPLSKYDKGKGKLVESAGDLPKIVEPGVANYQSRVPSTSSSSSVGRFVRKRTDNIPDSETLNSKNGKELAKTAALASQLEYEDEYDDSFDDLGLSVGDSGIGDNDSLMDRVDSERGRTSDADGGSSTSNAANSKWNARSKKPQFYVKDGKNYSYKVEGSVAAANYNEAALVNQAQKELIHGLGQGGNIPLGAVQRLAQSNEEQDDGADTDEVGGRGGRGNARVRGRGRGRNHLRRDRALSKHLSGLPGRYNH
ncbi:activating signal cointegrator 1 complex subunit 2 [Olea europaea subsp. europaea]|uniref:Activating signal cointegrator 1 complex subunit 2 n=1 Tax=Olea europaea subsp. europaea TaxID=158383 RepID=A0A8S0UIK3_OLEEU|nr:activating signal cointegrator 1 complex subunit 2 [Olea europaea subsp. europaea]